MTHICPACGKPWECDCTAEVQRSHEELCGGHHEEIACSERCAVQLRALLEFLSRYRG